MRESWDGCADRDEPKIVTELETVNEAYPDRVRVVPWECPYPPEQVPQVGEEVKGPASGAPFMVNSTPYLDYKTWFVRATKVGMEGSTALDVKLLLKLPAPTIPVGDKTYLEADVIERCKGLEEVDGSD